MKLIMESWRTNVLLTEEELLEENIFKNFFEKTKGLAASIQDLVKVYVQIFKGGLENNNLSNQFVGMIDTTILRPSMKAIKEGLEKVQEKFKTQDTENKISNFIKQINEPIKKVYAYLEGKHKGTFRKVIMSTGLAVSVSIFSTKIIGKLVALESLEQVLTFFQDDILTYAKEFLGETIIAGLADLLTGGITTVLNGIAKIAEGISTVAEIMKPVVDRFNSGGLTLSKFEESLR